MQHRQCSYRTYIGWLVASLLLSAILVVLFVFAARLNQQQICKGIVIEHIHTDNHPKFISIADISKTVHAFHPEGKPLHQIDLHAMEQALQQNPWMQHVMLFFDAHGKLHVRYAQKSPVLLIYTRNGQSFYIDKEGNKIPVSDRYHPDVPVVTGWFSSNLQQDSVWITRLLQIGLKLMDDDFWNAQVQQIDIQPDGSMVLIPTVGPVIQLGNAARFNLQCKVLRAFYEQVLLKGYMQLYDTVDVSVPSQIMAIRKPSPGNMQVQPVQFAHEDTSSQSASIALMQTTEKKSMIIRHTPKPLIP